MPNFFTYNTSQVTLKYTEYGRIVQEIAIYLCTIEDEDKRTQGAYGLIELMAMLNPYVKYSIDYREKLWHHLFHITDYKLDVVSPYPIVKPSEKPKIKIKALTYPGRGPKIRHYGKNIEKMVERALAIDDLEKRKVFQQIIGNMMKMSYKDWNNEAVTDEQIIVDLKIMSGGALDVTNSELDILHSSHKYQRKHAQNMNIKSNINSKNKNNKYKHNNKYKKKTY